MTSLRALRRAAGPVAASLLLTVPLIDAAPAQAAPAVKYRLSSIDAGVAEGAELAVDTSRRKIFVSDGDDYNHKDPKTGQVGPNPHLLTPAVSVIDADSRKVLREIDYSGLPLTQLPVYGGVASVPMQQVPVGIALDTTHGRVVTTNAHNNAATVVSMNAAKATDRDMVKSSKSLAHTMGVTVDGPAGRAYIAVHDENAVAVIDTATRREVARIGGIFKPSLLDVDPARHRLYVGNADTKAKKNNFVAVVDTRTNTVIKKIPTKSNSRPTVDRATGKVYAGSFDTGEVAVIDPDSLTVIDTIETGSTPVKIAVDSARQLAYTANLFKKSISIIDLNTDTVLATVPTKSSMHTVAVDEKTGRVYATEFQSSKLTVLSVTRS